MTPWSDGPISLGLAVYKIFTAKKSFLFAWPLPGASTKSESVDTYVTSLMQREQQNTVFEEWLGAYEIRLMLVGAAACKSAGRPESKKDETDPSPEVTSE